VYDFDPAHRSDIHDILRLLLAKKLDDCTTASEMLAYINAVWDDAHIFGVTPQKITKVDNCLYPCEDPLNSFYRENCEKCKHCTWDDVGEKRGMHTAHCLPKKPASNSETDRQDALTAGRVWNPYRKSAEDIYDEDDALISNRYSFLFDDGIKQPVPGVEIKRRFREHDYRKLNSDEAVLKILQEFSYHPLQTHKGSSFFFDYFYGKVLPDMLDLKSRHGLSEFIDLQNRRTNVEMEKAGKIVNRESRRSTYVEPPKIN
jgi:hypothetical protein